MMPQTHEWVCLCLFSSFPSLDMLFEGVPVDLASLLQTLILWPDLERIFIITSMYVPLPQQKLYF